jgi:hypothetical protein
MCDILEPMDPLVPPNKQLGGVYSYRILENYLYQQRFCYYEPHFNVG